MHRYIDNVSDNTVGGSYYSAQQAVALAMHRSNDALGYS